MTPFETIKRCNRRMTGGDRLLSVPDPPVQRSVARVRHENQFRRARQEEVEREPAPSLSFSPPDFISTASAMPTSGVRVSVTAVAKALVFGFIFEKDDGQIPWRSSRNADAP